MELVLEYNFSYLPILKGIKLQKIRLGVYMYVCVYVCVHWLLR